MSTFTRLCPVLLLVACAAPSSQPAQPSTSAQPPTLRPDEPHFAALSQLTERGENAEAYFSNDGRELILQAHEAVAQPDTGCDRIYRMPADGGAFVPVSSGEGATTCAYFLPGDQQVVYASTLSGGSACPPKPDHSQGYVWPLYASYEIYKANRDGTNVVRLTNSPGYDAEATVCKKDGSIVFTSARDGDLELYRMDADGNNVKRLTYAPGYDGGAFFNDDCTQLVWRASRPRPGPELDDFKRLLGMELVRPSKLELYTSRADGSDPTQLTYLNAASFGPYFYPSGKRIIFSSNYGDPKGREFDLWAINTDGTELERITTAPGFDGFPMFSPSGDRLVFASNRATAPGKHDTNVFMARWREGPVAAVSHPVVDAAARAKALTAALASEATGGRGTGAPGYSSAVKLVVDELTAIAAQSGGRLQPAFATAWVQPLTVKLGEQTVATENVAAVLRGAKPELAPLVVGAHLDHLGFGQKGSLDPDSKAAHLGADDNASGVAALLLVARSLSGRETRLDRDVYFVAFAAEELGVLGSSHFVKNLPAPHKSVFAMLNMDMVGRLRMNTLDVLGAESASEWPALVQQHCEALKLGCKTTGDGYGPSDQTPFYAAGAPVLHFFTGAHTDYHRPSDSADKLNYAGLARIAELVGRVAEQAARADTLLSYQKTTRSHAPQLTSGGRSSGVALGTIPDYGGPPPGVSGVLIAGVRAESAAEKAGVQRGDVLQALGAHPVRTMEEFMAALMAHKPGDKVKLVVLRDGKQVSLDATLEARR